MDLAASDSDDGRALIDEYLAGNEAEVIEQTSLQSKLIENKVKTEQALVGEKISMQRLVEGYIGSGHECYQRKSEILAQKYSGMRLVRGDGSCFYRALLFAQFEQCLTDETELERFTKVSKGWRKRLLDLQFPAFTMEDFCNYFDEVLEKIACGEINEDALFELINEDGPSNYFVTFLRMVASGMMKGNSDYYLGFIEDGLTVEDYCRERVEPSFADCDHLSISALASALGLSFRIEYLDQCATSSHHDFTSDDNPPQLFFLYRPGHYDILYKN